MTSIMCNILSVLLLCVWPFYIHKPTVSEESLVLPEVDLSNQPNMYSIIEKVVKDGKSSTTDKVHFLTVRLMNDSCGILVKIVAHTRKNLSWYDEYDGYAIVEKTPVIIINKSDIDLRLVSGNQGVFPMARHFDPPFVYDPDEWRFLIKSDSYARYYNGRGWIWYDQQKPNDKEHSLSD